MQFGICCTLGDAPMFAAAGVDFLDLGVSDFVPDRSDADYEPIRERILALPVPVTGALGFIPGHLKLTGPDVDLPRVTEYVDCAFERMSEVGIGVLSFGSGGARQVPEGFPREKALEQLAEFLRTITLLGRKFGIITAIEPLRSADCNIINTVPEGAELARMVNEPEIGVLADIWHMEEEGETPGNLECARGLLAHTHCADSGRLYPGSGTYDYPAYFEKLEEIGYNGRMSAEVVWKQLPQEAEASMEFLHRVWEQTAR